MSPESGSSVVSVPTSPGGVMFSSMEELESEMLVGAEVSGGGSISVNSMLKPVRGLLPIKSDGTSSKAGSRKVISMLDMSSAGVWEVALPVRERPKLEELSLDIFKLKPEGMLVAV